LHALDADIDQAQPPTTTMSYTQQQYTLLIQYTQAQGAFDN